MATNKNPFFTFRESNATPFTSRFISPEVEVMFTLYNMSRIAAINSVLNKSGSPLKSLFLAKVIAQILFLFLHSKLAILISPISKSHHEKSFLLHWEPDLL